ncbi:MAG TPA: hypothetical protein VFJ61_11405 [Solirubrobacterales bacterium]|nr:hypothetical protein [Solirubrobacterales bacterium]
MATIGSAAVGFAGLTCRFFRFGINGASRFSKRKPSTTLGP